MRTPSADALREHLAYEIHYLVLAAVRFSQIRGREASIYQDSALLHARTLLEFAQAKRPPGWWIPDLGGDNPQQDVLLDAWLQFINTYASHLGQRRLSGSRWPVPENERRLITLSEFALNRIRDLLPSGSTKPHVVVMQHLTEVGLRYLSSPQETTLAEIAQLIDNPI